MPTKFEEIYERAVFKFKDYSFVEVYTEIKEAILQNFLLSAIADFEPDCDLDLNDYSLEEGQFNIELNNQVKEILALGIAYHWLSSHVLNKELLRNAIHNKDYTSYSPANLLKEMSSLRDTVGVEYVDKIYRYAFRQSDYGSWRA